MWASSIGDMLEDMSQDEPDSIRPTSGKASAPNLDLSGPVEDRDDRRKTLAVWGLTGLVVALVVSVAFVTLRGPGNGRHVVDPDVTARVDGGVVYLTSNGGGRTFPQRGIVPPDDLPRWQGRHGRVEDTNTGGPYQCCHITFVSDDGESLEMDAYIIS